MMACLMRKFAASSSTLFACYVIFVLSSEMTGKSDERISSVWLCAHKVFSSSVLMVIPLFYFRRSDELDP